MIFTDCEHNKGKTEYSRVGGCYYTAKMAILEQLEKDIQEYEFAIPVKQYVIGSKDFNPGLCLKTGIRGSYSDLSSVYAK